MSVELTHVPEARHILPLTKPASMYEIIGVEELMAQEKALLSAASTSRAWASPWTRAAGPYV